MSTAAPLPPAIAVRRCRTAERGRKRSDIQKGTQLWLDSLWAVGESCDLASDRRPVFSLSCSKLQSPLISVKLGIPSCTSKVSDRMKLGGAVIASACNV